MIFEGREDTIDKARITGWVRVGQVEGATREKKVEWARAMGESVSGLVASRFRL